jgi:trimethylamine---corrinoid protein Co-methyltransferase
MFVNTMPRYEVLSEDAIATLDRGWRRIVSELGIEFLLPEAVEVLRGAGQIVEDENRVRFDPEWILEQVAKAPREFELQARNPTTWSSRRSTAARSSARAMSDATRRWPTSRTS